MTNHWRENIFLWYQRGARGVPASYPDVSLSKEGGKENSFPCSLALHHQSLTFRTRLCTENEAPEEEAGGVPFHLVEWMLGKTEES